MKPNAHHQIELFPEFALEDEKREEAQRRIIEEHVSRFLEAHKGYAKWVLGRIEANGPQLDTDLVCEFGELVEDCLPGTFTQTGTILGVLKGLWMLGCLWRAELLGQPEGFESYRYGIKGGHVKDLTQEQAKEITYV